MIDVVARLERLATLRDSGVLTEEEFAAEKAKSFCNQTRWLDLHSIIELGYTRLKISCVIKVRSSLVLIGRCK